MNTCSFCPLSSLADVIIKEGTMDKIKDVTTKQIQNWGDQQGSLQQGAEVVQLPHVAEGSRKPEAVLGPKESKTSTGQQSKNSSSKNTNTLPPIVWPSLRVCPVPFHQWFVLETARILYNTSDCCFLMHKGLFKKKKLYSHGQLAWFLLWGMGEDVLAPTLPPGALNQRKQWVCVCGGEGWCVKYSVL